MTILQLRSAAAKDENGKPKNVPFHDQMTAAQAELDWVLEGGGSFAMIDAMKGRLVQSHAERVRRTESGDLKVVGVNCFTESEPSPLADIAKQPRVSE